MTGRSSDHAKTARDQLLEAISARMLAAGASLRATLALTATVGGWVADCDPPEADLLNLAERLSPTSPTEGGTPCP